MIRQGTEANLLCYRCYSSPTRRSAPAVRGNRSIIAFAQYHLDASVDVPDAPKQDVFELVGG